MYLLILILPLMSSLCCGVLGFYVGRLGVLFLSCFMLLLTLFLSILIFYEVMLGGSRVTLSLWDWLLHDSFSIHCGLLFDPLTAFMLVVIAAISFVVHVYSVDYMASDPHQSRFMCYLSLFTFFMLLLVTADNFLQLFAGWEGVGLCSYLLINFWYTRILANKAAFKAMLMNRIADVFFMLALVLLLLHLGTSDYLLIFLWAPLLQQEHLSLLGLELPLLDAIALFLFIGAIGKSAQLGFHTWLPDAMEGPTPVSALLHAATMVTAGVFLLLRCSPLFQYVPLSLCFTTLIGGFTAFFFALVGIFQYDLKKVIAYSTCSQLGYMFLSCGLSNYSIAAFHLFNHAFFKALLFLGAGAVIHSFYDEQDMRRMGNSLSFLPFTYLSLLIASIAILGLPFLAGFYSKDMLLELALVRFTLDSLFVYTLAVLAALFTAIYSLRLLLLVFLKNYFSFPSSFRPWLVHDVSIYMYLSLFFLSGSSILSGYLFLDLFVGLGQLSWSHTFAILPTNQLTLEADYLPPTIKLLPVLLSLLGIFLGYLWYELSSLSWTLFARGRALRLPLLSNVQFFSMQKSQSAVSFFYWAGYFNVIYNLLYTLLYHISFNFSTKLLDKGYLELLGPFGFYLCFRRLSLFLLGSPSSLFANILFMYSSLCLLMLSLSMAYAFLAYSGFPLVSFLFCLWLLSI